jgi:putative ABC transport system permease protein
VHSVVEVASPRVFLEPPVAVASLVPRTNLLNNERFVPKVSSTDRTDLMRPDFPEDLPLSRFVTNGFGVLTYLANLIRSGDQSTPYSMVTAAGGPYTPKDMRDDEILVNQWLADDLKVKPGDSIDLSYYVPDSGAKLLERTNAFHVRGIVPLQGIYADRTLMPDFPGVAKAESTQDWEGFPLRYKVRDKDEAYWRAYRGTPKAFITLAAGQAMWASRFGSLTAVRYPVPTNMTAETCREVVYRNLIANLKPSDVGLSVVPVREQALKAADQSQDFGQLFLGFSLFLVIAALMLMALLFQFGLEQRAREIGTFLALGFTPKQVRRLLLGEGTMLALAGGVLGAIGGLGYAKAMIWGLTTVWRNAVGETALQFHASAGTLIIGVFASTIVATLTIWLTLRKQARLPAVLLLAGEMGMGNPRSEIREPKEVRNPRSEIRSPGAGVQSSKSKVQSHAAWVAAGAGGCAVGLVGWALAKGDMANAGTFFGAGALLLVAGLATVAAWLGKVEGRRSKGERNPKSEIRNPKSEDAALRPASSILQPRPRTWDLGLGTLGFRSCARRRTRSLATVALLGCGCFVIVSIGVFRLDANRDASRRSSGTGGFALLGESTMPVGQDLNTQAGLEAYALDTNELAGVRFVPFRLHEGDEASCLNLNRAQKPRLLGVRPELLDGRFTFAKVASGDRQNGWELLQTPPSSDEIPAIGDANSIEWALGKKIGDTIDYTDEHGRAFKLRLVGAVANSILQGSLIIDEAAFTRKFPSESGYRVFLLDAPSNSIAKVSATLTRAMQDAGLELTPTIQRLDAFNAVQNTYLGTFQVLGGLGLLLGSAGLGVVVLRNVLERRGELGVLVAVGFRRRTLHWLALIEHGALLALGLAVGIIAAVVAVLPTLLVPGTQLPYASLAVTLGAVLLNGVAWAWLATRFALRGDLLAALREE